MTEDFVNSGTEKVGWNLAQGILQEISNLLQGASRNYIDSNYIKAFSYLRAVRMRVPELKEDELKIAIDKENQFAMLSYQAQGKGFTYSKNATEASLLIYRLYGKYNDLILGYLKKYGYLIPPKEDRTNLNG